MPEENQRVNWSRQVCMTQAATKQSSQKQGNNRLQLTETLSEKAHWPIQNGVEQDFDNF